MLRIFTSFITKKTKPFSTWFILLHKICKAAFWSSSGPGEISFADRLLTREGDQNQQMLRIWHTSLHKKTKPCGTWFLLLRSGYCLLFNHQVDPERFELSSKHGTNYAFYMLSSYFIVGKGKANCLPVPSSVGVLSYRVITPLNPGQLCCSMPLMLSYKAEPSGTKAMLILN